MTGLLLLAALCARGTDTDPQQGGTESSSSIAPFLTLRSGVWAGTGFHFEAVTGSIRRELDTNALFSAGVDGGVEISKHFVLFGTYEVNLADDIFCDIAGACVGYREYGEEGGNSAVPMETLVYAGGMWGRFDVDAEGLWEFDDAWGLRAGISFAWKVGRHLTVDLFGEYRLIEFDYKTKPDSGDDQVGGSSGWVGLGLRYQF